MSVKTAGLSLVWLTVVWGSWTAGCLANVMEEEFVELCRELDEEVRRPPSERTMSPDSVPLLMDMARKERGMVPICSIFALGFCQDDESLRLLEEIAEPGTRSRGGAARYAIAVRRARGMSDEQRLSYLSYRLGTAEAGWERMLLANRIFVDFGEAGLPAIAAAAQGEGDRLARCDMLYYLSKSRDAEIVREVLSWEWEDDLVLEGPIIFFMGSITPGRSLVKNRSRSFHVLGQMRRWLEEQSG